MRPLSRAKKVSFPMKSRGVQVSQRNIFKGLVWSKSPEHVGPSAVTWRWFAACLVVLVAITCQLWRYRFERDLGKTMSLQDWIPGVVLASGASWNQTEDGGELRLKTTDGSPKVVQMVPLKGLEATEWLHLEVEVEARDLELGQQVWDDGRLLIEWRGQNGVLRRDSITSARGDHRVVCFSTVVPSRVGPASAVARIEHLGRSGEFAVTRMEGVKVRERDWWVAAVVIVVGLWLALGVLLARRTGKVGWLRSAMAGAIWLLALWNFVLPGPWANYRSIANSFELGEEKRSEPLMVMTKKTASSTGKESLAATVDNGTPPNSIAPSGAERTDADLVLTQLRPEQPLAEVRMQGSLILRIKTMFKWARPILHVVLLMVPALLIALFAGQRVSLMLSVSLAVLIESMQAIFGYGFDIRDCLDLLCDAAGITLGCWMANQLSRRWPILNAAKPPNPAFPSSFEYGGEF
jgi:hypothetical protein